MYPYIRGVRSGGAVLKKDRPAGKMTPVFLKSGYVLVVPETGAAEEEAAPEAGSGDESTDRTTEGGDEGRT